MCFFLYGVFGMDVNGWVASRKIAKIAANQKASTRGDFEAVWDTPDLSQSAIPKKRQDHGVRYASRQRQLQELNAPGSFRSETE